MGITSKYNLPYPEVTDKANVPNDMKELAEKIDEVLNLKTDEETNLERIKELRTEISTLESTINLTTEQIETVNKLQSEIITGLESELEETSIEGSNLNIQGSAKARAKIIPIADEIKQDTREGYNKLDVEKYYYFESQSILNGGSVVEEKGILKIDATNATDTMTLKSVVISKDNATILPAGTYYFGVNANGYYKSDLTTLVQKFAGNVTLDDDFVLTQWFTTCSVGLIAKRKLLFSNDKTKTEYEQYGAMPSPNYPSTVKVIEGDYEVLKQNKNILQYQANTENTFAGLTVKVDDKGNIILNGTTTASGYLNFYKIVKGLSYANINKTDNCFKIPSNTNYFFSVDYISGTKTEKKNNPFYIRDSVSSSELTLNVTFNADNLSNSTEFFLSESKNVYCYMFIQPEETFDNYTFNVRIEKEVKTDFILNETETLPISLGEYKLGTMGEASNYFNIDYVDENGYKKITKVDFIKNIEKVILNGSENWVSTTGYEGYFRYRIELAGIVGDTSYVNGMNSHFTQRLTQAHGGYEYLYVQKGTTTGLLYVQVKDFATIDDFKAWLSENNVTVYYVLSTPTTTEVTDTNLIAELEALLNTMTYKEVTNISTSSTDDLEKLDLNLHVDYFKSNLIRLKNVENAILSLGGNI